MQFGITEKLLLLKIQDKKDPEAFAKLYDQYVEKVFRFVRFKVDNKEEAEDITSEVFLKVWSYLIENTEVKITSFAGLVYKTARNNVIDFYRARGQRKEVELDPEMPIGAEDKNYNVVANNQEVEQILRTIKKLKQEYQEMILLKYVDELTTSEIAEILGKSNMTVRVTLHRATKKLKELYEQVPKRTT